MSAPDQSLRQSLLPLIEMLQLQTEAINRLAASNEALVQAMAEGEGFDEGQEPRVGLNGRPV